MLAFLHARSDGRWSAGRWFDGADARGAAALLGEEFAFREAGFLAAMVATRAALSAGLVWGRKRPDAASVNRPYWPLKRGEKSLAGSLGNWICARLAGTSSRK